MAGLMDPRYATPVSTRRGAQQETGMTAKMGSRDPIGDYAKASSQAQWDNMLAAGDATKTALSYATDSMGVTPFGTMYSPGAAPTSPSTRMPPSISALSSGRTTGGSVSGTGAGPSYQEEWAREDQLRREQQARQDQRFNQLQAMIPSDSARVTRTPADAAKESAARDAAFARAKETAGMNAHASMKALNEMVAGQGLMGSSIAAAEGGQIIGGAGSQVNDFLRDRAMSEASRASDISDMEYQGQVAQRGQEMSRKQAILSLLGNLVY